MRELVYYVAVTLDGFIAGPDGGDPTDASYFPLHDDLIEFIVAEYPETLPGAARQAMGIDAPGTHFDTALEGRATYEIGLAAGSRTPIRTCATSCSPRPWARAPTRTWSSCQPTRWRGCARSRPRTAWTSGSSAAAKLAHALLPEIDRLVLKQHAAVIGSGVPMFGGPFHPHLFRPAGMRQLDSGVRILSFDRR